MCFPLQKLKEPVLIDQSDNVATLFKNTAELVQADYSDVATVVMYNRTGPNRP